LLVDQRQRPGESSGFSANPIVNVGVSAETQANARRNPAPTGPGVSIGGLDQHLGG